MSTTRRDLLVRRRFLWITTAAVTAMLMWAYWGVHGPAAPMRRSSAPAVLAVDTARTALVDADDDARHGATGGDDFQTQISVASQSLSQAATADVAGLNGRQTLKTLSGLVVVYTGFVQKAQGQPDGSPLRTAYLGYARSVLAGRGTGILARLDSLQRRQRQVVAAQAAFDWTLWLRWALGVLLCAVLLTALLESQRFMRRRFRRRYNPWLLLTAALLACCPLLVLFTWQTHHELARAQAVLARRLTGTAIPRAAADVQAGLRGTIWRSSVSYGIPAAGAGMALAVGRAFRDRLADYGDTGWEETG